MASDVPPAGSGKELALPAAPVCRVCGEPLAGPMVVECCACGTLHHDRCWSFNRGCSVYGCGSRSSRAPARTPAHPGGSFEIEGRPNRRWSAVPLVAALAAFYAVAHLKGSPAWTVAVFAPLVYLALGASLASLAARVRIQVDLPAGVVHRRWGLFGFGLTERRNWLQLREIVELHLHHRVPGGRRTPRETITVYALLSDGRRRLLWQRSMSATEERRREEIALAERLAEAADCTVRHFSSDAAPSREELARIVEQWRVDAGPSRPALPPGEAPPKP